MVPAQAQAAQQQYRVIVGYNTPSPPRTSMADLRARGAAGRAVVPFRVGSRSAMSIAVRASSAEDAVRRVQSSPGVAWAEIDHVVHATWNPGDPRLSDQWGLGKMGAYAAWNTTRGSGATIAIVDTGVDYRHPDLTGRVTLGWDFVDRDSDPMDVQGHGTHVAGTAAATAGNGAGGAGVAPSARILAVRALDADGSGYYSWIAGAIAYAADNGADVINMSLGGNEDSRTLRIAVGYAAARGVVLTCASGNDGQGRIGVPARYEGCLSVGSSSRRDIVSAFSNRGAGLDVVAPGEGIVSSVMGGGYEAWDGTSMATPHVSGVAALLASQGVPARDIVRIIRQSARDLGASGWDRTSGYGRVDAEAAVQAAAALGSAPADVVRPSIAGLSVGVPTSTPVTTTRKVWRSVRRTGFRFVGYTPDYGVYDWRRVKTRGARRTVYEYRARYGVIRRRTTVERQRRVSRTTWLVRSMVGPQTISDNVGIDRVALQVDGSWVGTDWNSADGWAVPWQCAAGSRTFTLRAYDRKDNTASVSTQTSVTC